MGDSFASAGSVHRVGKRVLMMPVIQNLTFSMYLYWYMYLTSFFCT